MRLNSDVRVRVPEGRSARAGTTHSMVDHTEGAAVRWLKSRHLNSPRLSECHCWICGAFLLVAALLLPNATQAQGLGATMTTSLIATQGETLTYTVVITNGTGGSLSGVIFGDMLDPNTALVAGSINTSPLAFTDSYSALGNVQITIAAPGVLANDVDPDAVGPALVVAPGSFATANGGNVMLNANGGFTYNPPPGFEGLDTFSYTLTDGEGFTDTGTANITVAGMIWFVNSGAPAGGDGRLTAPFNSLAALAAINDGAGGHPASGDNIFLYSGNYAGPLSLLSNQKLMGAGAGASLGAIAGLMPPPGSLPLPATGGARPTITGNSGGVTLASGNLLRGLNLNNGGGTSLVGVGVGALTLTEMAITNTSGAAINLAGGALSVTLDSVSAAGGANGIRLVNCTGGFAITGDAALAQNGSGGTIQNTTGNAIQLESVANISLTRMNINNSAASGILGQNVNGLVVDWCRLNNNGDAVNEAGIRIGDPVAGVNGLTGTAPGGANPTRIANSLIRASGEMNVAIFNNGGTLAQLDVTNVISKDTRTRPLGADGFYFETRGDAIATVNFAGCSFSNNFTQGIQASALAQSVLAVNVLDCGFTNNNEGVVLANAADADLTFDLNGNAFFNNLAAGASGSAVAVVNATTVTPLALYSGKVRNNVIVGGGIDNHLVAALLAGAGNDTLQVANNNVNAANAQFSGIFIQAGETGSGNPNASVTVTGNTVGLGMLGSHGIVVQSRITSTLCAEIANNVSTTGGVGLFGINVRQRDTSTFRLPGFAGPFNSTAAVTSFVQGKNPGSTVGATLATAFSGGAACVLPLLAIPDEFQSESVFQVSDDGPAPADVGGESRGISAGNFSPMAGSNVASAAAFFGAKVKSRIDRLELKPGSLAPVVAAARQRWAEAGLTAEQLARIDALHFEVTDLTGWHLGASSGRIVQLDRRATGYGWFIDPTPMADEEFANGPGLGGLLSSSAAQGIGNSVVGKNRDAARTTGVVTPGSRAPSGVDLLTAVLHEMGHHLGLADDYRLAARQDVMYGFLPPGERRLPFYGQAREAIPDAGSAVHFMLAPLNIGTLPAGKSITVTFRATVANPLPPGICVISNQGTVTAAGGSTVLTDDPRTPGVADATLTTVLVPPVAVTDPATAVAGDGATLNGRVNPCGSTAFYYFEYGTNLSYGNTTPISALMPGSSPIPVSAPITGLQPGATHHFRLIATNNLGSGVGADRTFSTPLSIVQQPVSVAVCAGGTATFSVMANSGLVTYQWFRRLPGAPLFEEIPGATGATYTTPPVAPADDGTAFRVVVLGAGSKVGSDEAVLSVISIGSPAVVYDFNRGLPPNTAIYGNAYVDAMAGVLELNPNAGGAAGAFLTTDLAPGRVVRGFAATFRARLLGGSVPPADGFSFNWAPDLPNGTYAFGEEGEGSGLRVCIDTWDNGGGEAPAIDVWWGPNLVARRSLSIPFLVRGADFFDVKIRLSPDGLLDVLYACEPIFSRLPVSGYAPQPGARFGLGSRTGAAFETHSIDDLAIQLYLDPTNGLPRITSIAPQMPSGVLITGTGVPDHTYTIEASADLASWTWRGTVVANAGGLWQFIEPSIVMPPNRFYRLRAAPQFPAGLVNWWRAEGNFLDSFDGYDGTPINGLGFAPGQRGQAFSFDGLGKAMFLGGAPVPVPWTACFWVNRQDTPETSAALLADAATGLKLEQWNNTRQVGFTQFGVADYYFSYVMPQNTWTHLTFVGTPGGTMLYVNGVLLEIHPATINLPRGILGSRDNGMDHLKGLLDEIALFNRALTPAEIQQVMSATRGP